MPDYTVTINGKEILVASAKVYSTRAAIAEKLVTLQDARRKFDGPDTLPPSRFTIGDDGVLVEKRVGTTSIPLQMPSPESAMQMAADKKVPWKEGYESRIVPIYGSDERVDRYGDIVRQSWNFTSYNINPILLAAHDWDGWPIGWSIDHTVVDRADGGYVGKALRHFMLFPTKDVSELGDSIFRMFAARLLRTVSVGFFPGKVVQVEDDEDRATLGLGRWGCIFEDNELVELSPCAVPANPGAHLNALKDAMKSGVTAEDANLHRELARRQYSDASMSSAAWRKLDSTIQAIWKSVYPDLRLAPSVSVDEPVQQGIPGSDRATDERLQKLEAELSSCKEIMQALVGRLADVENRSTVIGPIKKVENPVDISAVLNLIGQVTDQAKKLKV